MAKISLWGLGFVGKHCYQNWPQEQIRAFSAHTQLSNSTLFCANNEQDLQWGEEQFPANHFDAAIVTFPLHQAHPSFPALLHRIAKTRILLGSTGAYLKTEQQQTITEESPLDPDYRRHTEEQAWLENGGILLRLSGLYGNERNPLRWLSSPRVGYSDRQLNLIHVEDIRQALLLMLCKNLHHNLYNLSDGQMHTWKEIIDFALANKLIDPDQVKTIPESFRPLVVPRRFCQEFPQFRFHDLFTYLRQAPYSRQA